MADNGSDVRRSPDIATMLVSREERQIQLKLIAGFFVLASLVLFAVYCIFEIRYAVWGATAQAVVVGYEGLYNSNGARSAAVDVDYQYFDDGAKAVYRSSYRLYPPAVVPKLGETFSVRYVRNNTQSSMRADDNTPGPLWATAPLLILVGFRVMWVRARGQMR